MSYAGDCTRVYTRTGQRAHLLPPGDSPNAGYGIALCDLQPELGGAWLGTGSQNEHEKAAALPLCSRCDRALTRRSAA